MNRISVGASLVAWSFILPLVLAVVCLGIAVAAEMNTVMLAIGAVFAVWTSAAYVVIAGRRKWLEAGRDGFVVIDRLGRHEVGDGDVLQMAVESKKNFSQGLPSSITRRVRVWAGGAPIEMKHTWKLKGTDVFGSLVDRLAEGLYRRSAAALAAGGSVSGEGWELRRESLAFGAETVPVADLSVVGFFDDHVCIWKRGASEAAFKVRAGAVNAILLERLLRDLLPGREGAPPAEGLGRVLFERKPSRSSVVLIWICAVTALGIGAGFAAAGEAGPAAGAWAAAAALGFWAWNRSGSLFRCHELGVMKRSRLGAAELRYEDVGVFQYGAVRLFVNGAYSGTNLTMSFLPRSGGKGIRYSASLQGSDDELEGLRDHVSKVVAGGLAKELEAGRPVKWTENLTLLPEGIQYRPAGFLGRKEPQVVPYAEVVNFGLEEGHFHLWVKGAPKSVIQEPVSQANFFPGFFLLSLLFSGGPKAESERPPADASAN